MPDPLHVFWSDDADDDVVEHVAEHGVTVGEAEDVLARYFDKRKPSRAKTGRWVVVGRNAAQRRIVVVFDYYPDEHLVVIVTAYEREID